ncbi:aldehyde ferredoxin oxidoreductase C-terminal domain-containing protein [Chloroflexota bacterium]
MDRLLRINMMTKQATFGKIPDKYSALGGRGLTSAIVANEVHPQCHPLAEENKLVMAPGLLTGTLASSSGRLSIGAKSPLTGGIKESATGGLAAQKLARLDIAAIIIEGLASEDSIYTIHIDSSGVALIPADELSGLGNNDVVAKLTKRYGDKVGYISIGQAGEMKLAASSIATTDMDNTPCRHAGRGGLGAVMGSKGVKAIVVDDGGRSPVPVGDLREFARHNKMWAKSLLDDPSTGTGMPAYGSALGTSIMNHEGALPTKNFRYGQFEGASNLSGKAMRKIIKERGARQTLPCSPGCIIRCHRTYHDKDGNYLGKGPEYETAWAFGANLEIDDLDVIVELGEICDDCGVDTIDTGVAIALAMEAGIKHFGDGQGALELAREIKRGSYLGRILGSGAATAARVFGVNRVPVVKGQAMVAYDPRVIKGMGITIATSTMGADHTAGYCAAPNLGWTKNWRYVPKTQVWGQVELSREVQIRQAAMDCTGLCMFANTPLLNAPDALPAVLGMINTKYGWNWSEDDFVILGKTVLRTERDFNSRAGFSQAMDRLPLFFYKEPVPPLNTVFDISDSELDSLYDF